MLLPFVDRLAKRCGRMPLVYALLCVPLPLMHEYAPLLGAAAVGALVCPAWVFAADVCCGRYCWLLAFANAAGAWARAATWGRQRLPAEGCVLAAGVVFVLVVLVVPKGMSRAKALVMARAAAIMPPVAGLKQMG